MLLLILSPRRTALSRVSGTISWLQRCIVFSFFAVATFFCRRAASMEGVYSLHAWP